MSLIKQLVTSVSTSVDQLVGDIENHDALIVASLREQRKKLAIAKVHQQRVQERVSKAEQEIASLKARCEQWQRRALSVAAEDEGRALACLQQRQRLSQQLRKLGQCRQHYLQVAEQLATEISRSEEALNTLSQRHQLLRARQSGCEVMAALDGLQEGLHTETAASTDYWEASLFEQELLLPAVSTDDELEMAFVAEENRQALATELATLLAGRAAKTNSRRGLEHE